MSTKTIAVHLPDGAIREVPEGTTPLEIANSISPRLAAASVVARIAPVTAAPGQSSASDGQSPKRRANRACMPPKKPVHRAWLT